MIGDSDHTRLPAEDLFSQRGPLFTTTLGSEWGFEEGPLHESATDDDEHMDETPPGEGGGRPTATNQRFHVPRSSLRRGTYGRMFRHLTAWEPVAVPEDRVKALASHSFPEGREKRVNETIPAGYTLLGQFVAHDVSFDPTTIHQRQVDPESLVNFRTPRLDLDSVYGGGPEDSPYLYRTPSRDPEQDRSYEFLLEPVGNGTFDVPRNSEGTALIPDPRNDRSKLMLQLHVSFMLYHNRCMRRFAATGRPRAECFRIAQRQTRWAFQWLVAHDLLGHLCGSFGREVKGRTSPHTLMRSLRARPRPTSSGPLGLYRWSDAPYLPIEFAVSILRVGHAMVRDDYPVCGGRRERIDAFFEPGPLTPKLSLDWDDYFRRDWPRQHDNVEPSGALEIRLADSLKRFHDGRGSESLAERDLVRAYQLGIPSGQDVESSLGFHPKDPKTPTPLWYYLLQHSERVVEGRGLRGQCLSETGARLFCDVLVVLLIGDSGSFVNAEPSYHPPSGTPGYWGMRHFLDCAEEEAECEATR